MFSTSIALKVAIGVLMVDAILELAFISSMVAWLHSTASGSWRVYYSTMPDPVTFNFRGEPQHLLVDQGHTSNGAAGTAFVLIGVGGIISLWLRNRAGKFGHALYYAWLVFNVLALMLTIGALGYVFSVTNKHRHQSIDLNVARRLGNQKYPIQEWTPQNWFSAYLRLEIVDPAVRKDIANHYRVMKGWQYNLIPLFLVQLAETVLAIWDGLRWRKEVRYAGVAQGHPHGQEKVSTHSASEV
ncbi:hypothetical protein GE09DRAFT_1190823 [Coniochaeta sp. 2T2.1]|nr:hypothetical protein GE09DRAFT_1190823 [Coniochaeta sp. 2T2.1]